MIYNNEGVRGLWRGVDASMVRTGIGSAVQLSSYDIIKKKVQSLSWYDESTQSGAIKVHFTASLFTSLLVCLAMNPFDVASTRMVSVTISKISRICIIKKRQKITNRVRCTRMALTVYKKPLEPKESRLFIKDFQHITLGSDLIPF